MFKLKFGHICVVIPSYTLSKESLGKDNHFPCIVINILTNLSETSFSTFLIIVVLLQVRRS